MKKNSRINRNIQFNIKNIRCFRSKQTLNIRPLTFLVGENSTGKTTILSSFNRLCRLMDVRSRPWYAAVDFNRPPYNMGSFEDIVSKSNNTLSEFQFGFQSESPKVEGAVCFKGSKKRSEPIIKNIDINYEEHGFNFDYDNKKFYYKKQTNESRVSWSFPDKLKDGEEGESFIPFDILLFFIKKEIASKENKNQTHKNILEVIDNIRQYLIQNFQIILNLAPVRSKPQRTYDPIKETPDPEGSETPMYLNRISSTENNEWKKLKKKLVQFGETSGLFTDIEVKKTGKSMGEPFQLHFKVKGALSNIMDIGYGVNQILPLLMRMFLSNEMRFLIQQPEVHLHPKAQAELSSLLTENIKVNENFFLIETHSDYMVDRVRIEIQKGKIAPDQVSLVYLESTKEEVKVHNISFDKQGNVLNAPTGYRSFFTREMNQVLGFGDK